MENLLDDIEKDISGDWEELQKERNQKLHDLKEKEYLEYLKIHPQKIDFPNFSEFHNLMVKIYESYYNNKYAMKCLVTDLLSKYFSNNTYKNEASKSFEYVWSLLCDQYNYHMSQCRCNRCNITFDVIIDRKSTIRNYVDYGNVTGYNYESDIVRCIECGTTINRTMGKVLGIFKHKENNFDRNELRRF